MPSRWRRPARAHPRSRGENTSRPCVGRRARGSSPLTRGKLRGRLPRPHGGGLIPAHAGKTSDVCAGRRAAWAHPRSRGENPDQSTCVTSPRGSSPLTRGKPLAALVFSPFTRLIPAHAGKTDDSAARNPGRQAHPRSRGENRRRGGELLGFTGSSPLTRGKLNIMDAAEDVAGLIPAHAGKTGASSMPAQVGAAHPRSRGENTTKGPRCAAPAWAHPRSRGENDVLLWRVEARDGSSPLTRGKRKRGYPSHRARRLIPAHAGKTRSRRRTRRRSPAHPRSRGENACARALTFDTPGSSPLTRGKHRLHHVQPLTEGLIPAHAGKTSSRSARRPSTAAHPRSRGENAGGRASRVGARGSSPLTRGKPRDVLPGLGRAGLIPAHAGKTCLLECGKAPAPAHPRSRGEN